MCASLFPLVERATHTGMKLMECRDYSVRLFPCWPLKLTLFFLFTGGVDRKPNLSASRPASRKISLPAPKVSTTTTTAGGGGHKNSLNNAASTTPLRGQQWAIFSSKNTFCRAGHTRQTVATIWHGFLLPQTIVSALHVDSAGQTCFGF